MPKSVTPAAQKVGQSPLEVFEAGGGGRAATASAFEAGAGVLQGSLVQFQKASYSVPYRFIGQRVLVMGNSTTVRIF